MPDHPDPDLISHSLADILRARVFAIACGYPDTDVLDDLRPYPAVEVACARVPESGDHLEFLPTMSLRANAHYPRSFLRMALAVGQFQIPTAYRKSLAGRLECTGPLFWNVKRV